MTDKLTLLGRSGVTEPTALLESFAKPKAVTSVIMASDEVCALCPHTGQPDQYTVKIVYIPDALCIESKSLKLRLQAYRNKGIFCEALSTELVNHIAESIKPFSASVEVTQKPRGGVSIIARSDYVRTGKE